ncbi:MULTISPECIES: outer membrane protein assembly factor BamA [unclassified Mesorhizobium]|uniref:outer membrane protein assembly factor BamA n=1 Tax=unclassified Mesorhizobium TaxID=325217 RepID=UPI000BB09960|nr:MULTISPECIES: outer membrane protein assembly factor BamA [unclassified Mesorhizobium]TGT59871.1 outer membrane protein assembly factor BamA [Mesorhizobium sp. M00.F.Ca.ET.170.01.1.1]AZO08027.1 outer membrane protein assembly factor BamA [Mesorhizobium sp. M3A.F.Ca.ET.080.04.2.1]PBB87022.1 outer membrane protein assembly factor BamA [Mesorhizobium sp. WSM3876]RWB70306.1 MAG: outer membrane protein assembly factor BamA [Mesorhizobium sp.]RWB91369.1 MAG: outer membrane protein assembly factor
MKAASKFLSAASAAALSAALVLPGAVAMQFVATSAAEAAVISRVEVSGNQRVDADTIRNYITIKPGKPFSSSDIDDAVKALFGTGLFSDVQINQVGSTLVVKVSEYKVVNQVLFQGNKKLKDNALQAAIQLKPRATFSQQALDADVESVKAAYRRIGRDDAAVTTQIMDLGDNRVNVVFNIVEGARTQIAAVNFVGNHAYSSRRLSDVINTKRSTWLSFVLRDDVYDEDKLRADQELLRRFYYNHGYADFQVVSAVGELDEATNKYTVTITVQEGERYTFGDVSVESTIPEVDSKSLESVVETHKGDVYNAKDVEDTIVALTEKVAGSGYAFAQVTPRGDRNFENHTISVVYTIDQGTKAYVERIEIRGNDRTRDYVIRREFDVSEGDAFNQVLIQRAKKRLEALNYFEKVEISTVPGSAPDQVVLVVDVVEKSTGEFSIGAGYSTGGDTPGPSVEGSITERNFLGRGQYIKLAAGGGKHSRDYSISFTEPYFLGRRIAAGFDVYQSTREYDHYDTETTGATIRFGLPITDSVSTQLAYNISKEEYSYPDSCLTNGVLDPAKCDVSAAIQEGVADSPWIKSSVSLGLVYNTIDDMKNPHEGLYVNGTTEVAGLGGDAKWVKVTGRASVYQTLSEQLDLVGLVSGGAGHVSGYGDDGLRIFDQFQSNDRMIRGFEYGGIGPVDTNTGDHLGGTTYFNASAEAQFPLPVIPESFGLRGAVFADAATLYGSAIDTPGVTQSSTDMKWRASVGVGLMWASPFGPIRIDYAVPVKKEPTDDVQEFNFGIATRF